VEFLPLAALMLGGESGNRSLTTFSCGPEPVFEIVCVVHQVSLAPCPRIDSMMGAMPPFDELDDKDFAGSFQGSLGLSRPSASGICRNMVATVALYFIYSFIEITHFQ
jgi:hypothetical protein